MEVERYKMIYIKLIRENLQDEVPYDLTDIIMEDIVNDYFRILGNDFVKNNKNKGKLIINNKKYKLKEFINKEEFKDNKIKINMILSKDLSNISHLFDNCYKLEEFSFYDDTRFIDDEAYYIIEEYNDIDIDYNENFRNYSEHSLYKNLRTDDIYSNCSEITTKAKMEEKHDNSTINYIRGKIIYQHIYYYDMSYIFNNCWSLSSLPDITEWNTNNVSNMSRMFCNCKSLSSLPDISKWNTNNVEDMSLMFNNCYSLSSLPDISKWKTNNVKDMSRMFDNDESLLSLQILRNGILIMLLI